MKVMKVMSNDKDVIALCNKDGIPVDEFSLEESQMLGINGIYTFVNASGGYFEKVDGVKGLQQLLNS